MLRPIGSKAAISNLSRARKNAGEMPERDGAPVRSIAQLPSVHVKLSLLLECRALEMHVPWESLKRRESAVSTVLLNADELRELHPGGLHLVSERRALC